MTCEHGLICTGQSVRGILDGTKTQTRRVVKPDPEQAAALKLRGGLWWGRDTAGGPPSWRCPYGAPGGQLWVREAFRFPRGSSPDIDKHSPKSIAAMCERANYPKPWCPTRYEADGMTDNYNGAPEWGGWGRLRPSIHMPRWASRITLDVTEVRVERVQDISKEDARAEGLTRGDVNDHGGPVQAFRALWDSINAKRAPWKSNPWVWCITFWRTK